MRERKKQIVFIGAVLLVIIIVMAVPGMFPRMYPMKAVYLEDESGSDIFVDLKDGFPFVGRIPQERLYDENGDKISETELDNGDVVEIYGDGQIAESSPAKYYGITKIRIIEKENQEYIEKYGQVLENIKNMTPWKNKQACAGRG